jgi:uncharacterized pyridoxal phosphate-containing UPF0001 family protein
MQVNTSLTENLAHIKNLITTYEEKYHRPSNSVTLLAVSKAQPLDKILAAYQAGQIYFAENYLQEALEKQYMLEGQQILKKQKASQEHKSEEHKIVENADLYQQVASIKRSPIQWHFIGPIQSNKTRKIAERFSWVHSVDSMKIAKRLSEQRPAHLPPLNICIQVNISNEASKSGVSIEETPALAEYCQSLPQLKLRGLMAIPAAQQPFELQRKEYHKLYSLWSELRNSGISLDTLSMGMSDDFEAAIAEGATIIRLGSALFGLRK